MKKIIFVISLLMFISACKAQEIVVPLEKTIEYRQNDTEIPDGTYLKDVNGLLNKYIGTWKGTFDKKVYTFTISKFKHTFLGISKDKLLIRYLIASPSGTVFEDTMSLADLDPMVIKGDYISKSKGYYVLNYLGKNSECGQSGSIFISLLKNSTTQMRLYLSPDQGFLDSKCSKVADQILPVKDEVVLNKQ